MSREIQRIVATGPGKVELRQEALNAAPLAADEVAGTTVASMISPGTEVQGTLHGNTFPRPLGYACVMRIEQVGSAVDKARVGELAFCMGHHASRQRCRQDALVVLPATLDPALACCARFMAVSMTTLVTTAARPPGKVLVMGLGLVGHMAARVFDACGYHVAALDLVASRRQRLAQSTRCVVMDQLPDEHDFDLVIDCTGHEQAVLDATGALRKGGELVLIGVPWTRRADVQAFDLLHRIFHDYIHVRSGWEWELPRQRGEFDKASIWDNLEAATRWLAQGRVTAEGVYDIVAPAQCQQAYDRLMTPGADPLTTVFDWTNA